MVYACARVASFRLTTPDPLLLFLSFLPFFLSLFLIRLLSLFHITRFFLFTVYLPSFLFSPYLSSNSYIPDLNQAGTSGECPEQNRTTVRARLLLDGSLFVRLIVNADARVPWLRLISPALT